MSLRLNVAMLASLLLLPPLLPLPVPPGTAVEPVNAGPVNAGPVNAGPVNAASIGVWSVQAEPGAGGYRWPVDGQPPVTRGFDPPAQRWLPGHRGVDLAAPPGTVVRAAAAGTVFFAGPVAGQGVVSVAHTNRLRTTYQPLAPVVSAGDMVAAGDPIGILEAGHAGCPVAACLHWGVRRGERYLDPLALLGLGRVRLLPRP